MTSELHRRRIKTVSDTDGRYNAELAAVSPLIGVGDGVAYIVKEIHSHSNHKLARNATIVAVSVELTA